MNEVSRLLQLMVLSIRDPREGLLAVLSLPLRRAELWQVLVLLSVLSALLAYLGGVVSGDLEAMREAGLGDPLFLAVSQVFMIALPIFAVHWMARMFGGRGSFDESMQTILWLQAILLVVQGALVVISLLVPLSPDLVVVLAAGILFYLLSQFVAVAHGFASALSVFLVTFAALFALGAVVGSFVMTYGGMSP